MRLWILPTFLALAALGPGLRADESLEPPDFGDLAGAAAEPTRPPLVGPVLDLRLTDHPGTSAEESQAEWQARLAARGRRATMIPLTELDPSRPLFLVFPGLGQDFRDLYGLVALRDEYQVVVGISDHTENVTRNAEKLADAVEQFMGYWQELGQARGQPASREVRIMGHSFGAATAYMLLVELTARERLVGTPEALFERVLFLGNDGPWRGADLPWIFTTPVLKQLASGLVAAWNWVRRRGSAVNNGRGSLINGTDLRDRMTDPSRLGEVEVQFLTVRGDIDMGPDRRHLGPINNWYSEELGTGDLELVWEYYREGAEDLGKLESWRYFRVTKKRGLRFLVQALHQDADYAAHHERLVEAAQASPDAASFGVRWDAVLPEIVDTFEGQHTRYMWEDERFLPWLRSFLAAW